MNTLAERIRSRMQVLDISQETLAERVGVSQPTISKLLSGKRKSFRKLPQLAEVLLVSLDWLATGRGPTNDVLPDEVRAAIHRLRYHSNSTAGLTAARAVNVILEAPPPYQ